MVTISPINFNFFECFFMLNDYLNEKELKILMHDEIGYTLKNKIKAFVSNEAFKIESVGQIYFEHKLFFLEQLMRSPLCKVYNKINLLNCLEKKLNNFNINLIYIECTKKIKMSSTQEVHRPIP
ncbi:hypothetical protein BpHYR1_025091 [Brachionus plicatilis]|uniref:Uncharacterized protein n=1 Tax=Brachionus plicatilis TaxID=10195 RepID=A0A3M7RHA3_BRAPC|nr:hypothetical protein BpHYR1_025091 [Brachionus plicatilis]